MPESEITSLKKILSSDWAFMLQIVTPILTVVWFAAQIQSGQQVQAKDIEFVKEEITKIENNHLAHIQDAIESIKDSISTLSAKEEKTDAVLTEHLKNINK